MSFMFNEKQKNLLDKYSKIWGGGLELKNVS